MNDDPHCTCPKVPGGSARLSSCPVHGGNLHACPPARPLQPVPDPDPAQGAAQQGPGPQEAAQQLAAPPMPAPAPAQNHDPHSGYLHDCFKGLVVTAEGENWNRDGLEDTPARAVRAWQALTSGYGVDVEDMLTVFDAEGCKELVLLRDVPFYSLCEHHLLPFFGKAHVAYLPDKHIVGVSKLARLLHVHSRRLQNQERITMGVANDLMSYLEPLGAAVVIRARHLCMEMRGVQSWGQEMVTSALRGRLEDDAPRAEVLQLMGAV